MLHVRMPSLRYFLACLSSLVLVTVAAMSASAAFADELPENLATTAQVSASSQFNDTYRPQMAISGVVPSEFEQDGGDWAVRGTQERLVRVALAPAGPGGADHLLRPHDQSLAGVLQGLRVYLNGEAEPAVRGNWNIAAARRGSPFQSSR